ncbi:hypothetical protein [Sulfitobacter aestuariivivens]|uniref:hypothetical protein n=1 Tax=Sulfitobacter aestuariivivens TaxID=2766981 RepID=UPI00360A8969
MGIGFAEDVGALVKGGNRIMQDIRPRRSRESVLVVPFVKRGELPLGSDFVTQGDAFFGKHHHAEQPASVIAMGFPGLEVISQMSRGVFRWIGLSGEIGEHAVRTALEEQIAVFALMDRSILTALLVHLACSGSGFRFQAQLREHAVLFKKAYFCRYPYGCAVLLAF